ncbi:hypothetical protein GGQ64_002594 [Rhizobium azooxidifex]|uniref:Uncharacterized protein n=1 Tax=Mycoplana azooxidifex TaxID=1636188 RepID=A0A7W6GJQ8_9HYPH|nr:hypothetical protein [Mycoplana azooxidifex]MBB3977388.1 hypothetical protein [Mycoplana azooxidifex]
MIKVIPLRDGTFLFPVHLTRSGCAFDQSAGNVVRLPMTALGRHFLLRALRFGDKLEWYGAEYDWDKEAKSISDAHRWCDRQERRQQKSREDDRQ